MMVPDRAALVGHPAVAAALAALMLALGCSSNSENWIRFDQRTDTALAPQGTSPAMAIRSVRWASGGELLVSRCTPLSSDQTTCDLILYNPQNGNGVRLADANRGTLQWSSSSLKDRILAIRTSDGNGSRPLRYQLVEFGLRGNDGIVLLQSRQPLVMPEATPGGRHVFLWKAECSGTVAACSYDLYRLDRQTGRCGPFGGRRGFRLFGRIVPVDDDTVIVNAEFPAVGYSSIQDYTTQADGNALWRIGEGAGAGALAKAVQGGQAEHPAIASVALFYDGFVPQQGTSIIRAVLPDGASTGWWKVPENVMFQPQGGNILSLDVAADGSRVVLYTAPSGAAAIDQDGLLFSLDTRSGRWMGIHWPDVTKMKVVRVSFPPARANALGENDG